MVFVLGMVKRLVMFGLIVLWVAMSTFQASAAVSAGGTHHRHTGMVAASMETASGHAHNKGMTGAHGHYHASYTEAGSLSPCHAPDSAPVSADLACCVAMCNATDVAAMIYTTIFDARSTSYSTVLMERIVLMASVGLERPPRLS